MTDGFFSRPSCLSTFLTPIEPDQDAIARGLRSLDTSEGESLLVSDLWSDLKLYRVSDGTVLTKLNGAPDWDGMSPKGLSLAFTLDGKTVAGGTGHGDVCSGVCHRAQTALLYCCFWSLWSGHQRMRKPVSLTRSHLINTNRAVVAPASGWHVSVKSGAGEDASGTLTHL
jgi:hypothetical protein